MRTHRPLRPVSCRRRTSTASVGTSVPRAQTIQISDRITPCGPVMVVEPSASIRTPSVRVGSAFSTVPTTVPVSTHHQYSLRLARPRKVAYFAKNRRTAAPRGAP